MMLSACVYISTAYMYMYRYMVKMLSQCCDRCKANTSKGIKKIKVIICYAEAPVTTS